MSSDINSINTISTSCSSFIADQPLPTNEIVKLSADEFYLPQEVGLRILGYLGHREKSAMVVALVAKERINREQGSQMMTHSDDSWKTALILGVQDRIRIINNMPVVIYPVLVSTRTIYGGHPSQILEGDVSMLEEEDEDLYTLSNQDLESRIACIKQEMAQGFENQTPEKVGVLLLLAAKNNSVCLLPSLITKLASSPEREHLTYGLSMALAVASCHGKQGVVELVLPHLCTAKSAAHNNAVLEHVGAAVYGAVQGSAMKGYEQIFTMICQAGLVTPRHAQDLLDFAIHQDKWDRVKFLLGTALYTELPHISGDCFVKALVWAAQNNHIEIVEKLIGSPFITQDDLESAYVLISKEHNGEHGDLLRALQQQIVALDSGDSDDENEFNDSGIDHIDNSIQVGEEFFDAEM